MAFIYSHAKLNGPPHVEGGYLEVSIEDEFGKHQFVCALDLCRHPALLSHHVVAQVAAHKPAFMRSQIFQKWLDIQDTRLEAECL